MTPASHPKLRRHLVKASDPDRPRLYHLMDRLGLASPLQLTAEEAGWVELMDGTWGVADAAGSAAARARFDAFVRRLDESLFLEGARFRNMVDGTIRPPRCIGCYEGEPERLRQQLAALFTGDSGPGLPGPRKDGRLRAALLPHIDYPRGGLTYAWGLKEVVEHTDASLFVIIGTSHYSHERFTLTRKDFQTPLGIVPTDQDFIDRLVAHYGGGLFEDEWLAHLPEHSIELEVVLLQYLYEGKRPIRIVPLVVGSFYDVLAEGVEPADRPDIARMVEALRQAQAQTPEPVCTIISGDLAHIGPKFQRPLPLDAARLAHSRAQDLAILRAAEAINPAAYFDVIAEEGDARNICGLPPTYLYLEALRPRRGKLLHYDRYVHPRGHESVSFASMAFYD